MLFMIDYVTKKTFRIWEKFKSLRTWIMNCDKVNETREAIIKEMMSLCDENGNPYYNEQFLREKYCK